MVRTFYLDAMFQLLLITQKQLEHGTKNFPTAIWTELPSTTVLLLFLFSSLQFPKYDFFHNI